MKFILPILFISLFATSAVVEDNFSTDITVENQVVVSINDKSAEEVRIYSNLNATSISSGAFDDCNFKSIMISSTISEITATFPNTLETINYTGNISNLDVDIPDNVTAFSYACDEGFLNYWYEYIRPGMNGSICNVTKENYREMKSLFSSLNERDRSVVVNTADGDNSTIAKGIIFLDNHFSSSSGSNVTEKEISQSVMITLILIIASFGMTSIGLFYILKDKNVIK